MKNFLRGLGLFVLLGAILWGVTAAAESLRSPAAEAVVLMYHSVCRDPLGEQEYLCVTPDEFEEQLRYLDENGYTTVVPGESMGKKSVMLTFDDGYVDNYTEVFPLLRKYNAKATVFMISSFIGEPGFLSADQLEEMAQSGHFSIQSHTKDHLNLTALSSEEQHSQMRDSKDAIEAVTGRGVTAISYPFGYENRSVRRAAARYFDLGFVTTYERGAGRYENMRVSVPRGLDIQKFAKIINMN